MIIIILFYCSMIQIYLKKTDIPTFFQSSHQHNVENKVHSTPSKKKALPKAVPTADRQTLEKLHQKAQALLNMGSLSSSSSDNLSDNIIDPPKSKRSYKDTKTINSYTDNKLEKSREKKETNHLQQKNTEIIQKAEVYTNTNHKPYKIKKSKTKSPSIISNEIKKEKNGPIYAPGR